MDNKDALRRVIKEMGSQKKVADAIRTEPRRVNDLLNTDRKVSFEFSLIMQHLMNGLVKIHDLRPLTTLSLKMANEIVQEWWKSYESKPSLVLIEKILQCNDSIKDSLKDDVVLDLFQKPSERTIIIDHHYHVITGHKQILNYLERKRPYIRARILNLEALLLGEDKIYELEDLFISEKVAIGTKLERLASRKQGRRKKSKIVDKYPQFKKNKRTREIIAPIIGFKSDFLFRQAKVVISNSSENLITAMDEGLVSISKAEQIAQKPLEEQESYLQTIYEKKGPL